MSSGSNESDLVQLTPVHSPAEDLSGLPVDALCELLSSDQSRHAARDELVRRRLQAVPGLLSWLLRPKSLHSISISSVRAEVEAQSVVVESGRAALPYLDAYVKHLERPNPFDYELHTRDGHTLTTYLMALDTAAELKKELRRAPRKRGSQSDSQNCCPICGGTRVKRDLEGSDREGIKKVRLFHDRRCKQCDAIWTPGCPTWGAWTCLCVGAAFVVAFLAIGYTLLFGDTGIPFDLDAIKATLTAKADALKLVGFASTFLGLPGLGAILFATRAFLGSGQDIRIQQWGAIP
jgi:hypothetical protein